MVAVARSILVIVWHIINDPDVAYQDLGPDWHRRHVDPARKTHDLVRQLERLGHHVTLTPTAALTPSNPAERHSARTLRHAR